MGRLGRKYAAREVESFSKREGVHRIDTGLYLRVSRDPKRSGCSWALRFMLGGRAREMGLGAYPLVSLETAREKALEARRLKADGTDPIDNRRAVRAAERLKAARALSFKDAA